MAKTQKSLGQHWLKDRLTLEVIVDSAGLNPGDVVLEIGPGLGTLTSVLLKKAAKVIAVEYDLELARKLPGQFPGKNLKVVHGDFLEFNLNGLPSGYKVVANVPYYITAKIIQKLIRSENPPTVMVLLVQQEVAEKLMADSGNETPLGLEISLGFDIQKGIRVPKSMFTPPPQVDSQAIILKRRLKPIVNDLQQAQVMRLVKAGFANPRKKLRSSLSAGLGVDPEDIDAQLALVGQSPQKRAGELKIEDWIAVADSMVEKGINQR